MKLLGTPLSPYARKARVALLEKNLAFEFVIDRPSAPDTRVPEHNPLGKVPVLVLDNGRAVYDSVVIVEYADLAGSGPKLIPEQLDDRIAALCVASLGDGIADAAIALTHDERYKQPDCDPQAPWYKKQVLKIERGLTALQNEIGGRDFCCGNVFTVGDIAAGMALGWLDSSLPKYAWREKFPGLKSYEARLSARPSFQQTLPPAR